MRPSAELMRGKLRPRTRPLVLREGWHDVTAERVGETIASAQPP
jgi:hypothetical protein